MYKWIPYCDPASQNRLNHDELTAGVNLEVMCPKVNCQTYGRYQILKLGLGKFLMDEVVDNQKCPKCSTELSAGSI